MRYLLKLRRQCGVVSRYCAAILTLLLIVAPVCLAQTEPTKPPATSPLQLDEKKYPGLSAEFAHLLQQIQKDVQFPAARGQSHLLPLLPQGTTFYVAMPNYGETIQQALEVFHRELKSSAVLREWWEHGEVSPNGAKIEDALNKVSQLEGYLGDEIVIAATLKGDKPDLLVIAQVRKPGLKQFLQQTLVANAAKGKTNAAPQMRVLDAQELALASPVPGEQPVVLVRADFVALATDVDALRRFNARLQLHSAEFAATDFGRRIAQSYKDGVTVMGAADLHKVLSETVPANKPGRQTLEQTGFADLKYLVWEHKTLGTKDVSQTELSFTGPRHGIASWLGAPKHLGTLDFVSPKAMVAVSVVLDEPRQIYDQVLQLASASNPNAAMLAQSQQMFGVDLKEGLLQYLNGEITFELDDLAPEPAWKVIFGVNDADHLQQALAILLPVANMQAVQSVEDGVTYYAVKNGASPKSSNFSYAFAGGHLIAGSSHAAVTEAVRLPASGASLARSSKFLDSLPPGHSADASAIFYENPIAMAAAQLRQGSPDLRAALAQLSDRGSAVVAVYGDTSAIRAVSTSPALDAGAVLAVAAVAIPNLMKSRMAANEASAVGRLRMINTAQVTYQMSYPERVFARDLATLGSDPKSPPSVSAEHAGLIDERLGNASCAAGKWCTNSGFRFTMTAVCKQQQCTEFVTVATPVASNTGSRSFCSTKDAVIRVKPGPPLSEPISVAECQKWKPLQ